MITEECPMCIVLMKDDEFSISDMMPWPTALHMAAGGSLLMNSLNRSSI